MKVAFLYMLDGHAGAPTPAQIEAHGVANVLAGESLSVCSVSNGPEGVGGTIVAAGTFDNRVGYYPAEQNWRRLNEKTWIGYSTVHPLPGPEGLARKYMVSGHDVQLADGRTWHAPKARGWAMQAGQLRRASTLPCRLRLGPDGNRWEPADVLPEYAELSRVAGEWFDERMFSGRAEDTSEGGANVVFSFADAPSKAARCLAANYRIGPVESDILGLWTTNAVVAVLDAAIDYPGLAEILKKKASGV